MQVDGKKLRQLRKDRRLSLEDLAARTGLNAESIRLIEVGRHQPRSLTRKALAEQLGVDVDDLAADEGTRNDQDLGQESD